MKIFSSSTSIQEHHTAVWARIFLFWIATTQTIILP